MGLVCMMAHRRALDWTLKEFRDNQELSGGTMILRAGDFRQTLPIIPLSTAADEINACSKPSNSYRRAISEYASRFTKWRIGVRTFQVIIYYILATERFRMTLSLVWFLSINIVKRRIDHKNVSEYWCELQKSYNYYYYH